MSDHRPITRSRSRKLIPDGSKYDIVAHAHIPPPLNIRKANALDAPSTQGHDPASIGLAVGSPSDSLLPPLPPSHSDYSNLFSEPHAPAHRLRGDTDASNRDVKDRKLKGTRWKNIGAFFGKKEANVRPTEQSAGIADPATRRERQPSVTKIHPSTRKRAGSDKEKGMELHNSLANKQVVRGPSLLRRASTRRKGLRKKTLSNVRVDVPRPRMNPALNALGQNPPSGIHDAYGPTNNFKSHNDYSLLQVEIPSVQLERYSIMFGNVLKPGSAATSKTSLLLPKHGILKEQREELLPEPPRIGDAVDPHRRKGSASSSSSKVPSFSLFPTPQPSPSRAITNKPLPRPSPLSRSVIEPAKDPAPRPPLKPAQNQDTNRLLTDAPGKENLPISKWSTTRSHILTHSWNQSLDPSRGSSHTKSHTRKYSYDPSIRSRISQNNGHKLSFDNSYHSAASHSHQPSLDQSIRSQSDTQGSFFDASEFAPLSPPLSPRASRSVDPMCAPPVPAKPSPVTIDNSKQAFLNRAFPARKSSLKRPETVDREPNRDFELPGTPSPSYLGGGKTHQNSESMTSAAEVSIARQISISRRRRQLLVPVQKTARQPLHPQFLDGEGRKSELVFFDNASPV